MMVGGIVLVMGLPAAGKTTLCKALAEDKRAKLWSLDEYPDAETLRVKNDTIFKSVSHFLAEDPTFIHIIDDTFHLKSMRKRYVMLAKEQRLGLAILHLDAPLEVLSQRNSCRDCRIDDSIIIKMAATFEPLCPSYQFYLVSSTLEDLWKGLTDKLACSQKYHCEFVEASRIDEVVSQNRAHKLGLLLNHAVSTIMLNIPTGDRRTKARHVIPVKQRMFACLKSNMHQDDTILTAINDNNHHYFHELLQDQLYLEKW